MPAPEPAPSRPHILFVCVENSCRSQIAEGFARALGGSRVEAHSAGSRPSGRVHPRSIEVMRERGIDLSSHRSKSIDTWAGQTFDVVVTMGCGDACPRIPARERQDWSLPDPKDLDDEAFRRLRDEIERRVRGLLDALAARRHAGGEMPRAATKPTDPGA